MAVLALTVPLFSHTQDGWLLSAPPPIVVRWDGHAFAFHFTNTGDAPVHGITLHTEKDGQKQSRVIIDTIKPHKTVSIDGTTDASILGDVASGVTITCVNYSKPLKVPFP